MIEYKKILSKFILLSGTLVILTACADSKVRLYSDVETTGSGYADSLETTGAAYDKILTLTNTYPHDSGSFTQGLFFYNGQMFESVGLYAKSALYKNIDLSTGNYERKYSFADDIFAEGSVVFHDKLYVLTWKENNVFVLNPDTLELEANYYYGRAGWGLTTDNEYLIASDGTSTIYFMDGELNDVRTITVTIDGREIENINELEYIDGYIWANVWLSNNILVIDKDTGEVVRIIDFTGLYPAGADNVDDVLNGIAYDEESRKIYITGKRWDTVFEFVLED